MPLKSGSSPQVVSENIREFHKGPSYAHTEAKFGKADADRQAVAVAMETARKARKRGGKVHVGPIIGDTGGRADKVAMDVPDGSYIVPADVVSGLGQGNTGAGLKTINKMFPVRKAKGGAVSIMAAHGETVISPEQLKERFGDDLDHAHAIMDHWVKQERQNIIKTMQELPGPAQD